uniref:LTD domain-containing protein n=1 Tax=Candidatus Methanogaster sp. ANME-2c ERB4 TaxID=2759911 RepID=A0A7G9YMC6_9EURY|nr:hypothetical protein CDCKMDEO_00005 [Methanosarcinales archaeon ANME-2c ERB4]
MNNGKIGMAMLIALSLGLLVSAASVQAADDVVINEIMYAPSDAFGGTYNEWVELYNNDTVEVNITGWAIDGKTIPAVTMQPGDYAIIAKNDTKFADCYPDVTCTVVKVAISLRNDGEVISLNDSSESMIDDADFTGCADLANKNNKTLERNATGGWEESLVDGGTPCAENSVLDEGSSTLTLAVSADPASVTVDAQTDVTFTVMSDDAAIENALVTLSGCGIDANGITGTDGTVVISVTATSAGTIDVTVTKDGYDDATTSVDAVDSSTPDTSVLSISDASVDAVGETATVNITADGVIDLANFDVTVTYDPAVVIVADAANDAAFGVAVTNLENAANGEVRLASLNFGDGQTGDGILISTLTLEATGEGTTALTLAINELKDSAENAITVSIDDGEVTVGDGNVTPPLALAVSADAANVTVDAQTDVTFTVTSDDATIEDALVTLAGCGVDANGTTGADGTVVISVNATSAGTIDVTATKDGYDDATTSVDAMESIPDTSVLSISDGAVDNVGDTCEVTITANGVTDLANFDVTVTYNPDVVVVTDAANDAAFGVAVTNLENAANGEVRLASLNFGDGQTGDGILISTLTLEATGEGTTALTLAINELKDSAENAITVSIDDGEVTVGDGNVTPPLAVATDSTGVEVDNQTDVTFTVTSDGAPIEGALVTLSGCGVETDGTTGADGTVTISVTATSAGTIAVTATKDEYADATATVTVKPTGIAPAIESAIASPNAILSDGNDSTTLTVVVTYLGDAPSVVVDLSEIGGSSEQAMEVVGDLQAGAGTWTTTVSTTTEGTFELPVTVSDAEGASTTAKIVLTAGPYKYTLNLKQGWNMVSLPYDITAVGIDTTQKLGDVITAAGETCYYVAQFNATSQRMESDIINPLEDMPQDTTYSIMRGQGYFIFVGDDLDFVVAGTLW